MTIMDNYYLDLRSIPVREHFEKKGGLDYLSWAKAWDMLKRNYPDSEYWVVRDEHNNNCNYFTNGNSGWVTVVVSVGGIDHSIDLAIMDHRNKAVEKDQITSVDVMNTIQRALTKAVAMHGLGIIAWTGEKDYISEPMFKKVLESKDYNKAVNLYNNYQLNNEQLELIKKQFKKEKK